MTTELHHGYLGRYQGRNVGRHAVVRWIARATTTLAAAATAACLLGAGIVHRPPVPAGTHHISVATQSPVGYTSTVDTSGTGGANTVRVPSMALTGDGSLIVCMDARLTSNADLPAAIDIDCRTSTDSGLTWSPRRTAVAHAGGMTPSTAAGAGDSSLTYDPATSTLWLSYLRAPAGIGLANSSTDRTAASSTTVHPQLVASQDDGQTWSAPIDLTALKPAGATYLWLTSGHGTVLADGTLALPATYALSGVSYATLVLSHDHGATWSLGSTIGSGISEHHIAQIPGGTLIDDARSLSSPYRQLATAAGPAAVWSTPTSSTALPDPLCNGDIVALTDGALVESNPDSQTSRVNLVARESLDGGRTWRYSYGVEPGAAGYSVMAVLQSGMVAVVLEHQAPASIELVVFPQAVWPAVNTTYTQR